MNKFYFLNVFCLLNISLQSMERDVQEKDLSCEVCPSCESERSEHSDCFEEISNDRNILGEIEKDQILKNSNVKDEDSPPPQLSVLQIEEAPSKERYEQATLRKDSGGVISFSEAKEELELIDKNPGLLQDPEWLNLFWRSYEVATDAEGFNLREPHLAKEILGLLKNHKNLIPSWSIENWSDIILAGFIKASSLTEKNTLRCRCLAEDTLEFLALADCFWDVEQWHIPLLKTFETLTKDLEKISFHALIISEAVLELITKRARSFMGIKELEWDSYLIETYGGSIKNVVDVCENQINNKSTYRLKSLPVARLILSFWQKNPTCEIVDQVLQKSWRKVENKEILKMILDISIAKKLNLPDKTWIS